MRHSKTVRRQSGGFTLIELIVVIGIIALLAGLLLSAIVKVRDTGPRIQTKAEIGQIGVAIENFKSTHHVGYVPSCLIISNDYSGAATSMAVADSRQYISRVWPKGIVNSQTGWPAAYTQRIDGNQALVLLLGGMHPNYQGFLNSPTNPFQVPPDGSMGRAFYDFKQDRLIFNPNNPNEIPHYNDFYGMPYLYFSSVNGNDYDYFGKRYYETAPDGSLNPDTGRIPGMTLEGGYGDPNSLTRMNPFRGLDFKYINPNGFQIVSMGKDKKAGRGSFCNQWTGPPWFTSRCEFAPNKPAWQRYDAGVDDYSPGNIGGDDIANFGTATLGSIP